MDAKEATSHLLGAIHDFFVWIDLWANNSNVTLPVILSFIAALIFWIVFSYIPERTRCKKLRPVVELALFDAYKHLFSLFDAIMRHHSNSPSHYQAEIRSGNLSEDTIFLGLSNKCLNDSYLYDKNVKDGLLVIGESILEIALEIDELANKVLSFHTYATPKKSYCSKR